MALEDHGDAIHTVVLAVEVEDVPAFVNRAGEEEHSPVAVAVRTVADAPVTGGSAAAAVVLAVEGHGPGVAVVVLVVPAPFGNGVDGGLGLLPAKDGAVMKPVERHAEVD